MLVLIIKIKRIKEIKCLNTKNMNIQIYISETVSEPTKWNCDRKF